jgi:hypothetical protein
MPLTSTMPENQGGTNPQEVPEPHTAGSRHEQLTGQDPPSHEGEADTLLTPEEEAELTRIKDLPKEVGVMLMTVGALGFLLPGVVGTPAVIAGGLVLWPKTFGKVENWFERRFPKVHKQSLYQINRYLNDLESRYPEATRQD